MIPAGTGKARILALACGLIVSGPALAQNAPVDPAAMGYARQIVDVVMPQAQRTQMIADMMRNLQNQLRDAFRGQVDDPGLRQIVDGYLTGLPQRLGPANARHMPRLVEAMAQAYVREFSRDELREISQFAASPAGKHYFARRQALNGDPAVVAANRAYFTEAQQIAQAAHGELRSAVGTYLEKHPDVARRIQGQQQPRQ
ncbi:MAG: DUF2059 domain-containing protein [Novosphingobium sp.]